MTDVAVVGAGVAGLAAATAAAERGASVVLFDQLAPGGALLNLRAIPEWPSFLQPETGVELAARLTTAALDAGVELRLRRIAAVEPSGVVDDGGDRLEARAVVVATGRAHPRLGVEDEDALLGRGLSHCATCDGPLYVGREVAVVGADAWAVHEALVLAELARAVTLVVPVDAPVARPPAANVRLVPAAGVASVVRTDAGLELALVAGPTLTVDAVFVSGEGAPSLPALPDPAPPGVFPVGSAAQAGRSVFATLAAATALGAEVAA